MSCRTPSRHQRIAWCEGKSYTRTWGQNQSDKKELLHSPKWALGEERTGTHDGELFCGGVPGKDFSSFVGPGLEVGSYDGVLVSVSSLSRAVLRKGKTSSQPQYQFSL